MNEENSDLEPLTLDFNMETKVAPRNQKIMNRAIKRVKIEFDDGEILVATLDSQQGFYRETYTFEEAVDGSRVQNRLRIYNVFWSVKEAI